MASQPLDPSSRFCGHQVGRAHIVLTLDEPVRHRQANIYLDLNIDSSGLSHDISHVAQSVRGAAINFDKFAAIPAL